MWRLFLNISFLGPYAEYAHPSNVIGHVQAEPQQLPQMPHLGQPIPQSGPPEPQLRHTEPRGEISILIL